MAEAPADRNRVETQFPNLVTAPASARAFLRAALQTWALDGFGAVTELLTDELVSNVVRHTDGPMTVRATRSPHSIRVEVDDSSTEPPILRHNDLFAETGRGIALVDTLSDRWGTQAHHTGKTVWFELDVRTATEEVHGP